MPRSHRRIDTATAWVLMSPAALLLLVFVVVPTFAAFALSWFSWDFTGTPQWVGIGNYVELLNDDDARASLLVTFEFVVLGVIPTAVLGFLLAALLNSNARGVPFLRVLYFFPVVISVAVSAVLWSFIYDPRLGPLASAFESVGITIPALLISPQWVTPALTTMMIWLQLPIAIILYLAGLQRVPEDLYDAAKLDGAGTWKILWSIAWPGVRSTTVVVVVLATTFFVATSLDVTLIMTNGGPLDASRALGLYAYHTAFVSRDAGYASTLSLLQLLVIASVLGLAWFGWSRRWRA
jgi:ABC-type sugar transport system permease subunit